MMLPLATGGATPLDLDGQLNEGNLVITPVDGDLTVELCNECHPFFTGEQRIVAMATLSPDTVSDEIEITDEMITAYYDENPSLFQLPESADVQYVEITRSDVAAAANVSEEEIVEYYEFNKDRYLQDEQRQARHILITFGDDEAAAEHLAQDRPPAGALLPRRDLLGPLPARPHADRRGHQPRKRSGRGRAAAARGPRMLRPY